jgi:hypothetical protein
MFELPNRPDLHRWTLHHLPAELSRLLRRLGLSSVYSRTVPSWWTILPVWKWRHRVYFLLNADHRYLQP